MENLLTRALGSSWIVLGALVACQASGSAPRQTGLPQASAPIAKDSERSSIRAHAPRSENLSTWLAPGPGEAWSLADILRQISQANPDLARAQAALDSAAALVTLEEVDAAPEFSLGLDYLQTDQPGTAFGLRLNQERVDFGPGFDATPGGTENWRKEVRLDWSLWKPDREARKRSAEAAADGARASSRDLEQRLRHAGIQGWFRLRAALEMQRVLEESVQVVEERLGQTDRRFREGAALKADVLRLQVRLADANQEAAQARLMVSQATSALNRLMDRPPQSQLRLSADDATSIPVGEPNEEVSALLQQAFLHRQDLEAARHRVRSQTFAEEAARASGGMHLSAFGTYGYDGSGFSIDSDLESYTLGLGLRIPMSRRPRAYENLARTQKAEAQAALRSLQNQIAVEVHDAHHALEVAKRQLEWAAAAVETAAEAYRITAAAQDAGGATVTDVLEAEDARKKAHVTHVAAQFQVEIARTSLARALGKQP